MIKTDEEYADVMKNLGILFTESGGFEKMSPAAQVQAIALASAMDTYEDLRWANLFSGKVWWN
jgi:hypothetical protein